MVNSTDCDVLVIGGGNAALCAALTAAEAGARTLILEAAPKPYRGGNSRHTRNLRCMHSEPLAPLVETYSEAEYLDDLLKVTGGKTDEMLARMTIRESETLLPWMRAHGVQFQPCLSGTLSLARTNAFFLGGGKALLNAYYRKAEKLGVRVVYEAEVTHLRLDKQPNKSGDEAQITALDYTQGGVSHRLHPKSIVVASGGFQADTDWLVRAWGAPAKNFLIRGTPYNRGVVLANLLDQGVEQVGDATQCHAVAIDGRAPKYDGGIVTRLDCVPFSIVVNKSAERFYDEGEDLWPKRYAIWGRLIAEQPEQIAYAIIDAKARDLFMPSVFPPIRADRLEDLARRLELSADALTQTVEQFNAACGDATNFHPTELDGVATTGLTPSKTNWARPISEPPFYGYPLRTGVTFTYLGLKVNERARCSAGNRGVTNLWAAGETMAGSILGQGYLAGFGMTIGTVFGRIAGKEASDYANSANNANNATN